ncbi:MAG: hypothetical protein FJW31_13365 [Acidobacteria bacterium]|nr:hypothetical protein [Acidobacteriota bacterium]
MRTIIALCLLVFLAGGFFVWRAMQMPSLYGTFSGAPQAAVSDLIERPKDFAGKTVSVEGTISGQGKTMG